MLATARIPSYSFPAMASGYKSLYLEREDLDQEQVRFSTFVCWPMWVPRSLSKESMAKNGLHFTGDGDMVKCFSCKVVLGNWKEGDDPLERHRKESPNCRFLKEIERLNESRYDDDDLAVDGLNAAGECDDEDNGFDEVDGATERIHVEDKILKTCESSYVNLHGEDASGSSVRSLKTSSERFDKKILKQENSKLRNAMMCRKCEKERIQTLFLPCRHLVTCEDCAEKMENCIQCNELILGTVRTFMI